MNSFNGLRIFASAMLTKQEDYELPRSWGQRLFTLPWRPLKKTQTHVRTVPSRDVIRTPAGLFMHPSMAREIEAALRSEEALSRGEPV